MTLAPKPGERIVDACAGAGGKSLHLAALMKNKGRVISMDIHETKLAELRKRAVRAGADIIETRWIDSNKVIKRLNNSIDRVLLDVPCTGLGVLRRNPDAKWKLKPENLLELLKTQHFILENYSKMLKTGGTLVYSTCSILPDENENQVKTFLRENPSWNLESEQLLLPDVSDYDGFYIAKLKLNS